MLKLFKKGGVSLMSDTVTLVSSLFTMVMMLFVIAIILFIIDNSIKGEAIGEVFYGSTSMENSLISLLDKTYDGHRIMDLITYVAYFKNDVFTINGKEYEISKILSACLFKFSSDENGIFLKNLDIEMKEECDNMGGVFNLPSSLSIDFGDEERMLANDFFFKIDENNKITTFPISVDGNHYNLIHRVHKG